MSELLRNPLIMSVADFRKRTGKATDSYNDEQVEQYIAQLDLLAELFIQNFKARKEVDRKNIARG